MGQIFVASKGTAVATPSKAEASVDSSLDANQDHLIDLFPEGKKLGYSSSQVQKLIDDIRIRANREGATFPLLTADEQFALAWYTSDVRDQNLPMEKNWWFVVFQLIEAKKMDELQEHRDGIYYLQLAREKLGYFPLHRNLTLTATRLWVLKDIRLSENAKAHFRRATIFGPCFTSASHKQSTMERFRGSHAQPPSPSRISQQHQYRQAALTPQAEDGGLLFYTPASTQASLSGPDKGSSPASQVFRSASAPAPAPDEPQQPTLKYNVMGSGGTSGQIVSVKTRAVTSQFKSNIPPSLEIPPAPLSAWTRLRSFRNSPTSLRISAVGLGASSFITPSLLLAAEKLSKDIARCQTLQHVSIELSPLSDPKVITTVFGGILKSSSIASLRLEAVPLHVLPLMEAVSNLIRRAPPQLAEFLMMGGPKPATLEHGRPFPKSLLSTGEGLNALASALEANEYIVSFNFLPARSTVLLNKPPLFGMEMEVLRFQQRVWEIMRRKRPGMNSAPPMNCHQTSAYSRQLLHLVHWRDFHQHVDTVPLIQKPHHNQHRPEAVQDIAAEGQGRVSLPDHLTTESWVSSSSPPPPSPWSPPMSSPGPTSTDASSPDVVRRLSFSLSPPGSSVVENAGEQQQCGRERKHKEMFRALMVNHEARKHAGSRYRHQ